MSNKDDDFGLGALAGFSCLWIVGVFLLNVIFWGALIFFGYLAVDALIN